jgi:hypothetical protein
MRVAVLIFAKELDEVLDTDIPSVFCGVRDHWDIHINEDTVCIL